MSNIALIAVIVSLALIAFYRGKGTLFCIISSFYPSIILYKAFPYTERFVFFTKNKDQLFISHFIVFFVFFLAIFFIMRQITHTSSFAGGISRITDAILLSVSVAALTLVLSLHILPAKDIYNLSGSIQGFFISDLGYFLSLLFPLGVIYYLSKRAY